MLRILSAARFQHGRRSGYDPRFARLGAAVRSSRQSRHKPRTGSPIPSIIAEPATRMRVSLVSRIVLRTFLLAIVVALAGCSWFQRGKGDPMDTLPVEQLYQQGVEALDAGNNDFASRTFQRLITRFPFGPYTEQSHLNLAYTQYKASKPEDAYSTVNRFIKTYPTHRHIDYAYYLRGLINFNRSSGFLHRYIGLDMTQRDQANLRQSFEDFGSLVTRYPQSRYTADARQRMVYLRNMMAQSELNIALYYLKRGAYVGSSNRAKAIIETYPQTPQAGDALAVMMQSYRNLGQEALAADAERVLKLNYPDHASLHGDWPDYPSNWWKVVPLSNPGN
jgi:outer membrane protein assembly factor BamD